MPTSAQMVASPQSLKRLPLPIAALALAVSSWTHAVETHDLQAQSVLGQPLQAQLKLSDISPQQAAGLRVRIASDERYQAASLQRAAELANADIQVHVRDGNAAVVEITTTEPIHVPVLNVLLDLTWPTGQLNPQFAIQLDAPTTGAATASATIDAPVTVVRGDTLSQLMITHRYGIGTMAQRLIATQRGNPKAFIRNNVNWVRAGAHLRMPDRAAILAIDAQEAQRLVNAQMADFDAYRRALAERAQAAKDSSDRKQGQIENAVSGGAQAQAGDRLALTNGQATEQDAQLAAQKTQAAAQGRQRELVENIKALKDLSASLSDRADTPAQEGSNDQAAAAVSQPAAAARDTATDSPSTTNTATAANTPTVTGTLPGQAEPQWITQMKSKPWLMPALGILLLLLALWVWVRRSQAPKPAESSALNEAAEVANSGDPVASVDDDLPTLDPESTESEPRELSALLPDVDLDLPDLDAPTAPPPVQVPSEASLLEEAKAKMRNGDLEGARALAEEALTSADPMIQDNAKAFLERL